MILQNDRGDCFQYRFDLLKQEIDNLQEGIRSYDKILMTIKSWAITVFSGLVVLSTRTEAPNRTYYLLLGLFVIYMFWLLDGYFKGIQRVYSARYREIETILSKDSFAGILASRDWGAFEAPDLGGRFEVTNWERWRRTFEGMFLFNTYLFYLLMALAGIGLLLIG